MKSKRRIVSVQKEPCTQAFGDEFSYASGAMLGVVFGFWNFQVKS